MKKTSVLLVDDHNVVRQGLRALLASEGDIAVIGEAENGRQAVALAGALRPNVVLMDVAMPRLNGYEATRQIVQASPSSGVLILTSYEDEKCVRQAVRAGASGYVLKHTAADDLLKAIRAVRHGESFFSPAIALLMRNWAAADNGPQEANVQLTPREAEVLQLVAEGFFNKEIADELNLSIKTVEKHRQRVMDKLNLHDTASLTRYALSNGIVESKTLALA